MKKFDIPVYYKSNLINKIKELRKVNDPRKKDYSPALLEFGNFSVYLARHFGFCYGVENAIEIAYKAVDENPGKRVFLISEMIHNPGVNEDLTRYGVQFLTDTLGNEITPFSELTSDDVVIIPAFGTTIEIEQKLNALGVQKYLYNTTCPFVEKVWKKSAQLGEGDHTVVIHGKYNHEETRATFSHTVKNAPAVIVKDMEETKLLARFITGEIPGNEFYDMFAGRFSEGFDADKHLVKVGVVNQTTMLATETQEISDYLKEVMITKYGAENIAHHYADTRDTLCYATNDNQRATIELLNTDADFAVVVGGYNSSNTTHIVEILEEKFPVYYISDESKIDDTGSISFYDIHKKEEVHSSLPGGIKSPKVVITSGASCPDSVVERVMGKLAEHYDAEFSIDAAINSYIESLTT
ncbi:MAG: 4-hydroxy-3-methylbut-2-enyl diphosphate reductase [Melioribacteraceae bacterium]|nr:MAG: 4-hydroxy-3-methylbut-2-enyl diphosphate reductase [Melioribacteraceae bacterium]